MSNIKISQLPAAGAITGAELVPVVQGGGTKQTTVAAITASKVSSVTASAPLASSGGATPNISFTGTLAVANGGTGVTTSTGTGATVRNTSPTLVTPALGAATATSLIASANAGAVPGQTLTGGTTVLAVHGVDGSSARQLLASYGAGISFDFRRANGTAASPTAVQASQGLGSITGSGYGASAYSTAARASINLVSAENWTNSAQGTFLTFTLTPAGGVATTEVARFESTGRFELGNYSNNSGPALTTTAPADLYVRSGNQYTDNSTAASGTVAHGTISSFGLKQINAVNASVTYTNASTIYVHGVPQPSANVTITNPWAAYIAAGKSYLGDSVDGNVTNVDSVGFRGIPLNSQTAAYTTVAADAGKTIVHPITDNNARTFTIDSNANVPYPVGTAITFINMINTVTIAITTDTMYLAGTGATGSRTLAAYGMATAVKVTSTSWIISGNGLT